MTCPEQICAAARRMVGVKWRHQGRSAWAVDCVGLIVRVLTDCGFDIADRKNYGRYPWRDGLREAAVSHFGEPVPDMRPGDVVLMQWPNHPQPGHVGIIVDGEHGLNIVHSYGVVGVVEHRIDDIWSARIKEVFRPCR